MNCPQCSRVILDENMKFCPGCGCPLILDSPENLAMITNSEVPVARKSIVGRVVWSIILMGLGVHGGIAALFMGVLAEWDDIFLSITILLGFVSAVILLSGISLLVSACKYKKQSMHGFEVGEEMYHGHCEMCGAESNCLVYRKVDSEIKYMKLCDSCAHNNIASCDVCGNKNEYLKRCKINDTVGWADMCLKCAENYKS